jgi:hypothetical protein
MGFDLSTAEGEPARVKFPDGGRAPSGSRAGLSSAPTCGFHGAVHKAAAAAELALIEPGAERSPLGGRRRFDPFDYGLPPPRCEIRRLDRDFETEEDAEAERGIRVESLRRTGTPEARRLAARLLACAPDDRCLLLVCPFCMRRLRIWCTGAALRLFRSEPALIAPTLIPARAAFPPAELHAFCPRRFGDALRQQLRRVGVHDEPVYGGIDADYDAHTGLIQPHYHVVAAAELGPAFEELGRRFYAERGELLASGKPRVYRPALTEEVASRPEPISYTQKAYWPHRSRGVDGDGTLRRTRPIGLKEPLHGQWLLWRSRFGLTDFIFLSGIRRCGGELRPIGPRGR